MFANTDLATAESWTVCDSLLGDLQDNVFACGWDETRLSRFAGFRRRTTPYQPPAAIAIRIAAATMSPSGASVRKMSDRNGIVRVPVRIAPAIADTVQKM